MPLKNFNQGCSLIDLSLRKSTPGADRLEKNESGGQETS